MPFSILIETSHRPDIAEPYRQAIPKGWSVSDNELHERVVRVRFVVYGPPAPGLPWENGYVESFNARLRDELLDGEIFYSLREAQIMIENWRWHYNTVRPHGALGYRPPAPEVFLPAFTAWPAPPTRPAPPPKSPMELKPTLH